MALKQEALSKIEIAKVLDKKRPECQVNTAMRKGL
jgi:hypothetical protein